MEGEEKRENGFMMIEVELGEIGGGGNGDMGIKARRCEEVDGEKEGRNKNYNRKEL